MKNLYPSLAAALLAFAPFVHGTDDSPPISVEVIAQDNSGNDTQMAYHVREKIRASHTFKLVSAKDVTRVQLYINTIEPAGMNGLVTFAVVWTLVPANGGLPYYLSNSIGVIGKEHQDGIADSLLASTEKQYNELMEKGNTAAKKATP